MGPVGRGNSLEEKETEYCIHGWFHLTEDDKNGRYGACWVPLRQLYSNDDFASNLTCGAVDEQIDHFESEQKELRVTLRQEVEEDRE